MREPLKTRRGCDRCKLRRKKCDEQKPVCGSCTRLKFICTWSKSSSQPGQHQVSASPGLSTEAVANGSSLVKRIPLSLQQSVRWREVPDSAYVPFRDHGQFCFSIQTAQLYSDLISPAALPEYHNTSYLTTVAIQHEAARDALAGFSAYILYSLDESNSSLKREALRLYQRALSTIHKRIRNADRLDVSMELLMAVTFLGLMESLGTGDPEAARIHFLAAARLCLEHRPQPSWAPSQLILYRIVVECWLYNIASTAVFYRDCDEAIKAVNWSVLQETFGGSASLDASTHPISPHLGGNHGIYWLMLQMTWFARQTRSPAQRESQALGWAVEIDRLERRLVNYFGCLPYSVAELYHAKFQLTIYGLRIILAKIQEHEATSTSPVIRQHIENARKVLTINNVAEYRNPALAWPLVIFLLAADDESTLEFFTSVLLSIHQNFDIGHKKRLDAVVKQVRSRRMKSQDGLDLLLQKDGILGSKGNKITV